MITRSEFKPAWWLPGCHAQTIWPSIMRRSPDINLTWERLELPDGDFIDLVWTYRKTGPIVILLHGLEGSINSHYAKTMLKALEENGLKAVLMHFRGCSGKHNRKDRSYHSGDTSDLRFLIQKLSEQFPGNKLTAVGFSLGGNVLLKYLGEQGKDALLDAAVAISVPFDLSNGANCLNKGYSKLYQRHLIQRLQNKINDKFKDRDAPFPIQKMMDWNTFNLFDHHVTAPLHGFKSGKDYYQKCSSRKFLKSITVPALLLHSKDDPFISKDAIPNGNELSNSVQLELSERGGHVGFVSGDLPWRATYWLEKRIPEFLNDQLSKEIEI